MKETVKKNGKACLLIALGTLISAVAINAFLTPQKLLSGGLTGVAMLINYATGFPSGVLVFILNVPLFIYGFWKVSGRFVFLSAYGMLMFSLFFQLTSGLNLQIDNVLVAAIFGGVVSGAGTGLALRQGGCMGGLDIVSVAIHKRFSFPIGMFGMAINVVILTILGIISGLERALITLIYLYVYSVALDAVQAGFNRSKTLFIISKDWVELKTKLSEDIHRGVTVIYGEGGYTNQQRPILYCMVHGIELSRIKEVVHAIDPAAFISVIDTREIQGKGFGEWKTF